MLFPFPLREVVEEGAHPPAYVRREVSSVFLRKGSIDFVTRLTPGLSHSDQIDPFFTSLLTEIAEDFPFFLSLLPFAIIESFS